MLGIADGKSCKVAVGSWTRPAVLLDVSLLAKLPLPRRTIGLRRSDKKSSSSEAPLLDVLALRLALGRPKLLALLSELGDLPILEVLAVLPLLPRNPNLP